MRQPQRHRKKAEAEAARAVMPGNIITVVARWLSNYYTLLVILGHLSNGGRTHQVESHKCYMITHVTHDPWT